MRSDPTVLRRILGFGLAALIVTPVAPMFRSASYRDPARSSWTGFAWQYFLRPASRLHGQFEITKAQAGSARSASPPVPPITTWLLPIAKDTPAEARILPLINTWARRLTALGDEVLVAIL